MDGGHKDRVHAELSASAAARWLNCPGSVRLCAQIPAAETSNPFAEEGTRAHELAETLLLGGPAPDDVDPKMLGYCQAYVDYVAEISGAESTMLVEARVSYAHIAPGGFGTADALVFDGQAKALHVIDLKYGKGVRVEAEGNPQLRLYAEGARHAAGFMGWDVETVHTHVFQPRIDNISVETLPVADLDRVMQDYAARAALTQDADAPLTPGEAQCRWCPAKAECPALATGVISAAAGLRGLLADIEGKPDALSVDDLARALAVVPVVDMWAKAVRERAYGIALSGGVLPGWKIVDGRKTRTWSDADAALAAMRATRRHKIDEIAPRKVLTPAQAEKLFGKNGIPPQVADLIEAKAGAPSLVPEGDKRPAKVIDATAGFETADREKESGND